MRAGIVCALLSAHFTAGTLLAAKEPPGAWFLNANGTGGDYVYFSVGGGANRPPIESREVLLGWSWNDAGTTNERYPGAVPARYRPSRLSGKQPRQWHADSRQAGVPRLGIGPGRELLLLGDDEGSTALAARWAEMLDSVEAAFRHSSPDLEAGQRHGVIEIGRAGRCAIRSVPVDGDAHGWSTLLLAGHARPSRTGGYYYVDPHESPRAPRRTIEVRRFLRFLDGPEDCGGRGLALSLIPAPREEAFYPPYFLVFSDLELRSLSFLDLEPTPRTPAVRTLGRGRGAAREKINIANWPAAGVHGIDLCQAPFMKTLCLKDLRIREQLATSAVVDPEVSGPLKAGCREFFDRLGPLPSPHPCSNPRVWRRSIGTYRTGYTGDLVLHERPLVTSRLNNADEVQWLWPGSEIPNRALELPLADGTRIELGLPRTRPPGAGDAGVAPTPPPATSQAPSPADPPIEPPGPAPSPNTRAESATPPSGAATDPLTGTQADPGSPMPETASQPTPPTARPPTSESADESTLSLAKPAAGWLWPLALMVLGMTVSVALLLRSQRVSAKNRRRALSSGLIAEEPGSELLLEEDSHGERLLAGRESSVSPTGELPREPADLGAEYDGVGTGLASDTPAPEPEPADSFSRSETEKAEPGLEAPGADSGLISSPLEPPKLSESPATIGTETCWGRLAREHRALEIHERQGITQALETISRLGDWVSCLLPVLDDIQHGRRSLPALERLPQPGQREWRQSCQALREFTDFDLVVFDRLHQELAGQAEPGLQGTSRHAATPGDDGAEGQYLSGAGLLDAGHGSLPERLRRHLLRPGSGRLQELVLSLQYLIEAFTVEHLEKPERKAFLGAVRGRLQDKGLSTRFHHLVGELANGLGLRYSQARYYKARIDDPEHAVLQGRHATVDLSQRLGYPAGTENGVVVRLSELFLTEAESGNFYSGRAWIDEGS